MNPTTPTSSPPTGDDPPTENLCWPIPAAVTPVSITKGCGGVIQIGGVIVRMQIRYEPIIQSIAGIAYTPYCSVRCPNMSHLGSLTAWSHAVTAQLIDRSEDNMAYIDARFTLEQAGAYYARIIRKNMAEVKLPDSSGR